MLNRHTAYKFNNGASSQNRVVVPPMASQTADPDGFVTVKTVEYYSRLAQSGAGLNLTQPSLEGPVAI